MTLEMVYAQAQAHAIQVVAERIVFVWGMAVLAVMGVVGVYRLMTLSRGMSPRLRRRIQ